jgi:deoxyribonuclease-4
VTRPLDELGAHVSVAGGLALAPARGRELGCGAIQIFLKNQRQWAAPPLDPRAAKAFRAARRRHRIRHAFAHGSYLVNLATPVPAAWQQAVDTFSDELRRAEALGLGFLVVHPGSHLGAGHETGLAAVARAVDEALARVPRARVRVALENTAGGGHTLGGTFEDLAAIIGRVRRAERVGVCLDTCHLLASGYDICSPDGYASTFEQFRRLVGFERLKAFHLNDSKRPLGSRVDRHEHIGKGFLGLEPFRRLVNDRRFCDLAMLLETPKAEGKATGPIAVDPLDEQNLNALRGLMMDPRSARNRRAR